MSAKWRKDVYLLADKLVEMMKTLTANWWEGERRLQLT